MFYNSSASFNKKSTAFKSLRQGGFGLVELMVSISIMVIVSAIILTRQSSFNSAVLLRGQAYKIALQVREVQLSAVSASSDGSGNFRSVLGLHFNKNPFINGKYYIFKDANNNNFYDSNEIFGIQGILDSRFEIRDIRTVGPAGTTVNEVSVIFERPNFDAKFFTSGSGVEPNVSSVEIDIARRGITGSGTGVLRTIEITSTGQITVKS